MAISFTNGTNTTGNNVASISLSSLAIPPGAFIVVCTGEMDSAVNAGPGAVSDSASNSYTVYGKDSQNGPNSASALAVNYGQNSKTGSNVTSLTYTAKSSSSSIGMAYCYATGVSTSAPFDNASTISAVQSTTTPSVTSGTPTNNGSLAIGWIFIIANTTTVTVDSGHGWNATPIGPVAPTTDPFRGEGQFQLQQTAGTITWSPTLSTGTSCQQIIAIFQPDNYTQVFLTTSSTSPWTVPSDFTAAGHYLDLVGAGGSGAVGTTGSGGSGGGGGQGGNYGRINYSSGTITPGSTTVPFTVAAGGSGNSGVAACAQGTTWEASSAGGTNSYSITSGNNASGTTQGSGSPSFPTNGTPSITYVKGIANIGGGGASSGKNFGGGGGGGSGGPSATGAIGGGSASGDGGGGGGGANNGTAGNGPAATSTNGAAGGQGSSGTPGAGGLNPTSGTGNSGGGGGPTLGANITGAVGNGGSGGTWPYTFDSSHDVGGGGGGGGSSTTSSSGVKSIGGTGGNYGGGGGGTGYLRGSGTQTAGVGGSGLIVINYQSTPPLVFQFIQRRMINLPRLF